MNHIYMAYNAKQQCLLAAKYANTVKYKTSRPVFTIAIFTSMKG